MSHTTCFFRHWLATRARHWPKYLLWLAFHGYKGDFHSVLLDLHRRYGDIVRIGPNELSVINPDAVKTIYGFAANFEKSDWYSIGRGTRKFDLFAEQRESVHRVQRRLVNKIYSTASLKKFGPCITGSISQFIQHMRKRSGQNIDLGIWMQLLAFDLIGEVTFSKSFGLMDQGKEAPALDEIKQTLKTTSWSGQIPHVYWAFELLVRIFSSKGPASARNGSMREFATTHAQNRLSSDGAGGDMLEQLMEVHSAKQDEFSMQDVLSMALTNVFAGSDTTAISMRAIIYYLLTHGECRQKLVNEVDDFALTEPVSEVFSFDIAIKMPYLQAVMYEALRLHPVVGQTLPRVIPSQGFQCGTRHIPGKTTVGTSPYVLGRSKAIFGEDADLFRPERWLGSDKGELQRFWFPFGAGSRTCIDKNLSWIEMSKVIPTLFRHFEIRLIDPSRPLDMQCFFFLIQTGLHVTLLPRNVSAQSVAIRSELQAKEEGALG